MREYGEFADRIARSADLDAEALPGQTVVEIYGDRRVLIEHHRGIVQYGSCEIRIKVKFGSILVSGKDLGIQLMTKERLVICGNISGVQICKGG